MLAKIDFAQQPRPRSQAQKLIFCPPSNMIGAMISQETLHTITMLSPQPIVFNWVQLAHQSLRLTPAQQFMVRCRWRQLSDPIQNMFGHMVRDRRLPSGRYDGPCEAWYSCGARRMCEYYVNDKRHGLGTLWYACGNLMQLTVYINDRLCGESKRWHRSGQLQSQATYVDGKLYGESKWWSADGKLMDHCIYDGYVIVEQKTLD